MKRLIVLLVLLTAACAAPDAPLDSGIEGQALVGPMCPVMIQGQECPDQPLQTTMTVLDMAGGKVTRFETDEQGRFKVGLPPGDYILRPESPGESQLPFASEMAFTVLAGEFTQLTVLYDSGIR